ncbi:MAG TPA: hypothetical protein DCR58_01405 [Idiomarina baltica]|uniref:Uncharacterized protein n=2 Tax=Alteromonadales TaxID=135622 RepID=A0A358DYS9_9ALTE|nr:hypothetical protein [Alteromonas australica]HAI73714.1 hypothetical protein [Alteromonas australica]HAR55421.1 hypothetical protein [Idiomarina baltica]HBU51310.1 hypothetical protein [Alteromonas australica]|tara:strand:- start:3809 stop:4081 length:273 start_codon:yes stop_codon:yes gene_type:complete
MTIDNQIANTLKRIIIISAEIPVKPLAVKEAKQVRFCLNEIGYLEQCLVRAEKDSLKVKIIAKLNEEIDIVKMLYEGLSVSDIRSQLDAA